jgi:hypothetical protein
MSEMEIDHMRAVARGAIERHLGDVAADYDNEEDAVDAMYDEAYTLAFDALVDLDLDHHISAQVAHEEALKIARP